MCQLFVVHEMHPTRLPFGQIDGEEIRSTRHIRQPITHGSSRHSCLTLGDGGTPNICINHPNRRRLNDTVCLPGCIRFCTVHYLVSCLLGFVPHP